MNNAEAALASQDNRSETLADKAIVEFSPWDAFVLAQTAQERCTAWLALIFQRVPQARVAAILIENQSEGAFVPMAVWPQASVALGYLGAVVEQTLRERRGVIKAAEDIPDIIHIGYPVLVGDVVAAVVVIEVLCRQEETGQVFQELHWGSAWLLNLLSERELSAAVSAQKRLESMLETLTVLLRHGKQQQALFELVSVLRRHFSCIRVALGLVSRSRVRMAALSEAATFEKHGLLVKAYEHAMDEALDENNPLSFRMDDEANLQAPMHKSLCQLSGSPMTFSFPLVEGSGCVAVLTLECDQTLSNEDVVWFETFGALAAPILIQRQDAERGAFRRIGKDIQGVLEKLFGPRHLLWKSTAVVSCLLIGILTLTPVIYRVSAKTVIEGEVQRVVAAPFEGFIGASYIQAGDNVTSGQLIAQLDDRELRIEEAKWSGERDQYESRLREAMALHDLTAMQVVGAQLRQAQAQLTLVNEKISKAQLSAPFDGVVVSGDLSQQIGAPVEAGKKLFEIAPLKSYRIVLQVDERDIGQLKPGQKGRLLMTGIAGVAMDFKVMNVTPVATAKEGRNFFRVEAVLEHSDPGLRPGMEGVGKIDVGQRSLWWVLTHNMIDWLRLTFWTWIP